MVMITHVEACFMDSKAGYFKIGKNKKTLS